MSIGKRSCHKRYNDHGELLRNDHETLIIAYGRYNDHSITETLISQVETIMPYSPRQVSAMLQIPASSLRRLSKDFSDQLSSQKSRHRQYTESDIDILKRVREMTASGMTLTAVKTELTLVTPDQPEQPASVDTLALIPTISHELTRLDDLTRSIILEFEQIRNDHQTTVDRLSRLEAWSRLSWWKRIFTRPPEA